MSKKKVQKKVCCCCGAGAAAMQYMKDELATARHRARSADIDFNHNVIASTALLAEKDDELAQVRAELEEVTKERDTAIEAINWASGYLGDFPPRVEGVMPPHYQRDHQDMFYWQQGLQERAGLCYLSPKRVLVTPREFKEGVSGG